MTLQTIYNTLKSISGFSATTVAYRAFSASNTATPTPFIIFYEEQAENFAADNIVYHGSKKVRIELYTEKKDTDTEALVEAALTANGLFFEKYEDYIDSEKLYEIAYSLTI